MKLFLAPLLLVLPLLATAAVLQPGEALPVINLKDQHEKPLPIARETKLIFFATEMDGSRLMSKALATLPPSTLKDRNALYIADISDMPGLVSSVFAVPSMQREAYTVGVIRDPKEAASLPRKPGAVTVLKVDAGKVVAIEYAQDMQQITRHLK